MSTLIIGGGWSGLAAAITLSELGHPVLLLESASQLGGRARNVQWQGVTIDNGQHLMVGAYQHMLDMFERIGITENKVFSRFPIDLTIHDSKLPAIQLSANGALPWPLSIIWNLSKTAGLSATFELHRLQRQIPFILKLSEDISVAEWLLRARQSSRIIQQIWEPLCLATLNTPINVASAYILAQVLNDSLGQGEKAADFLIPKQPLGDLFPIPAANYIKQHGGQIELQTRVSKINVCKNKIHSITTHKDIEIPCQNIIVAASPSQTTKLISPSVTITNPVEYPICTLYLQYSQNTRLAKLMLGMTGTISQWIFDRSNQIPGMMAVVISGPGPHMALDNTHLVAKVIAEVHQLFPHMPSNVEDSLVIREKRATFACTTNVQNYRLPHKTAVEGLWLAGDYCDTGYPATLEGAIRSGENCAKQILSSQGKL